MKRRIVLFCLGLLAMAPAAAFAQPRPQDVPTPTDVKPGSITCEDVPYPFPVSYLPLTLYGQDMRIAFMDVAAARAPPTGTRWSSSTATTSPASTSAR